MFSPSRELKIDQRSKALSTRCVGTFHEIFPFLYFYNKKLIGTWCWTCSSGSSNYCQPLITSYLWPLPWLPGFCLWHVLKNFNTKFSGIECRWKTFAPLHIKHLQQMEHMDVLLNTMIALRWSMVINSKKKKKHKMSVHKVDTSSSRKTPQYSAVNSFQTRFSVRLWGLKMTED